MITLTKNENRISITIVADLLNRSKSLYNLQKLKDAIIEQVKNVFSCKTGNYNCNVSVTIQILNNMQQCSPKRLLFEVVDIIKHNNPAEADFKGLRIKLNSSIINDVMTHKNSRTIPHEIGHIFGWDHPHAPALYESINLNAHELEQQLTEAERKTNLMSQSWYAQKAGVNLHEAINITEKQINVLLENYFGRKLNKNHHLKYFLWWRRLL